MTTFITWIWGDKYANDYVVRLRASISRRFRCPHHFVCFTDRDRGLPGYFDVRPIEDPDLLAVDDGCYVRLRMFDPDWQFRHGFKRIVSLDLDLVLTGDITPLFLRDHSFMILKGGHFNPCPFNGSVMMLQAGAHQRVWHSFDTALAFGYARPDEVYRGTDQTWISALLPDAAHWTWKDGIYAYRKPGWPRGGSDELPIDARIVAFPGSADPSKLMHLKWITDNWV